MAIMDVQGVANLFVNGYKLKTKVYNDVTAMSGRELVDTSLEMVGFANNGVGAFKAFVSLMKEASPILVAARLGAPFDVNIAKTIFVLSSSYAILTVQEAINNPSGDNTRISISAGLSALSDGLTLGATLSKNPVLKGEAFAFGASMIGVNLLLNNDTVQNYLSNDLFYPSSFTEIDNYSPIGAFYESITAANDNALSIADKIVVLLDAAKHSLTATYLASLDSNHDGKLSGAELNNLSTWVDTNENGIADAGEIKTLAQAGMTEIRATDYSFYARGNSHYASSPAAALQNVSENAGLPAAFTTAADSIQPSAAVPFSNYRTLRDTDNVFNVNGGSINWASNQVKINYYNQSYLIGTDGNDNFDANWYAAYTQYFNSNLLVNFLAGGGNDVVGGSARNDNVWGGTGNDTLLGYAGDDKLYGEEGDDQLQGGEGNDQLEGGIGNDVLLGENGNDILLGSDGIDELQGGNGNDQLVGGSGNDNLFGQTGDDNLWGGDGDDILMGFTANNEAKQTLNAGETDNDSLYGEGGNDNMFGGLGNDMLDGGIGNDLLDGGAGDDKLFGQAGNDQLHGGEGNDQLDGGIGDDVLLGENGNDILLGGDGIDELQGGNGNDQLVGGSGNDNLFGQTGDDNLWGGDGDDILMGFTANNEAKQSLNAGETDNDTLYGGRGTDNIYGGLGNDTLDGGDGNDFLNGDEGNDRLFGGTGSDQLQGGSGNDSLMGEGGDDRLFGQVGDDVLYGGDGNDILLGFTAINEAKQNLSAGESDNDTLYGGAGNDVLMGGLGNDMLDGGTGVDELQGGDGNDSLYGGEGDDHLFGQVGDDVLYGGDGNDVLVGFTASNETKQTLNAGESDNDWLYGGAGNDILLGGFGNDYLDGGAGVDIMDGGAGDDTYIVNSVNDSVYEQPNDGYDTVISSSNYILNNGIEELRLVEGFDIHGTGNALNNKIIGNSRNNILDGVTGADVMIGGKGDDTYYVDNIGDQAIELAGEGVDTVNSSITTTLSANLENLMLLDFSKAEKGLVDGVSVLVYGYPKRNELDYMQGDAISGYQGTCALTAIANLLTQSNRPTTEGQVVQVAINNHWAVTDPSKPAAQRGGSNYLGQQSILNSYGLSNDLLGGYNEAAVAYLIQCGRGVIIALNAGKLWDDAAYVDGGGVNHVVTVTGAVYAEANGHLKGFYIADSGRQLVNDMTRYISIEKFREAANVANAYAIYTLEPLKLWDENINGTGNILDNQIVGNRGNNVLSGGDGNDTLAGGDGNDTLLGGNGDDILDGGTGEDAMIGGSGNDTYTVGRVGDVVIESANEGTDTVQSRISYTLGNHLENLTLIDIFDINGTGNALDNSLTGNAAINTLSGAAGNDTLIGRGGNDTLIGGTGNDTYVVDNTNYIITENVNEGLDTVLASVSTTLSANVENLTLTGTSAINGSGNALNNLIIGNEAANTLEGGDGNDTLDGGANVENGVGDILNGGAGNDTFIINNFRAHGSYNGGSGIDTLDFSQSDANNAARRSNEKKGVLVNLAYDNVWNYYDASTVKWSLDDHTHIKVTAIENIRGTSQADYLAGDANANVIEGGGGDDWLDGGLGNDSLIGGLGDDTYVVDSALDLVSENVNEGLDTVLASVSTTLSVNVENLTLSGTSAINGSGNALDNVLFGNSANNVLDGAVGDDWLDGGLGNDSLIGGLGDDTYVVDSALDLVSENANEGLDTVLASVNTTLAANVENLTLTGTSAINGSGNTLNNLIIGNEAANTLEGGDGNDTLDGGANVENGVGDILNGGAGNDTFIINNFRAHGSYNGGSGIDTLDFSQSDANNAARRSNEKKGVLVNLAYDNVWNYYDASTGKWSPDDHTHIKVTAIENIRGTSQADFIVGDANANVIEGGAGNDWLDGGLGNDAYVFGRGYGVDTVNDADATVGNSDVLRMNTGINYDQLWFKQVGNNLEVSVIGTTDKTVIQNWYSGTANHVEQIKTVDGNHTLLDSKVQSLVNAMASMTAPPAGQTSLTTAQQATLAPLLAANWQ